VNVVCRILGHLDGPIERLETRIDGQAEKLRYWQCERCRLTDRHPLPSCGLDFGLDVRILGIPPTAQFSETENGVVRTVVATGALAEYVKSNAARYDLNAPLNNCVPPPPWGFPGKKGVGPPA
jgi:hypothetical protein